MHSFHEVYDMADVVQRGQKAMNSFPRDFDTVELAYLYHLTRQDFLFARKLAAYTLVTHAGADVGSHIAFAVVPAFKTFVCQNGAFVVIRFQSVCNLIAVLSVEKFKFLSSDCDICSN